MLNSVLELNIIRAGNFLSSVLLIYSANCIYLLTSANDDRLSWLCSFAGSNCKEMYNIALTILFMTRDIQLKVEVLAEAGLNASYTVARLGCIALYRVITIYELCQLA